MSESNGIVWEDPPQSQTTGKYATLLEELRANPRRWALVRTGPYGAISSAGTYLLRFEGIEVARRNRSDGSGALYARYVGSEGKNEEVPA